MGHRRVRVDDIANAVGISKRTLYECYPTKQDMIHAALSRRFQRLRVRVEQIAAAGGDEHERLRDILIEQRRVYGDSNSALMHDIHSSAPLGQLLAQSRAHGSEVIEALLKEGISRGVFRAVDVSMTRLLILAAVDGLCSSGLGEIEPVIGGAVGVIVAGLDARGEQLRADEFVGAGRLSRMANSTPAMRRQIARGRDERTK